MNIAVDTPTPRKVYTMDDSFEFLPLIPIMQSFHGNFAPKTNESRRRIDSKC